MSKLAARMKYLRNMEAFFAVALFPILGWFWLSTGNEISWPVRVAPLALVCYILAQGATYWALKYRQYAGDFPLPLWLPRLFRLFRTSNVVALLAVALGLALGATRGIAAADLGWGVGLWAFAVLEHINYYHRQLMYDTCGALRRLYQTRRLRQPMLACDMRRNDQVARTGEQKPSQ